MSEESLPKWIDITEMGERICKLEQLMEDVYMELRRLRENQLHVKVKDD